MPTPCSILGCRTNRTKSDPSCSVFNFPKEPVRLSQWEWAIHQLYDPTYTFKRGNKICSRHFETDLIEKEHRAVRDDGSILILPRKSAALVDSAVPTLFDFLPDPHPKHSGGHHQTKHEASTPPVQTQIVRRRRMIPSLYTLGSEFHMRAQKENVEGWQLVVCKSRAALSLYKIEINKDFEPVVKYSVTLKEDLSVKVVHPEVSRPEHERCDDWNKLFRLLRLLDGESLPGKKRCRLKVFEKADVVVLEITHPDDDQSLTPSLEEQGNDELEINSPEEEQGVMRNLDCGSEDETMSDGNPS